jgi:chorismate synthase
MEGSAFSLAGPHAGVAREEDVAGARADVSSLVVRRLASHEDYAAAVELQRLIWGQSFRDVVPTAILKVTQRVGGVTAGAFDPDGDLVGFVYGLTGFYDGRLVHWSHMLGVRPELRDHGIGRRLKEFQRELLAEAGIEWIYWTFDPLVARNAHINFNKLGVEVDEYVPNMYGVTDSALHGGVETDRLVVAWSLGGERREARGGRRADDLTIEIPADFETLVGTDPMRATRWRTETRAAFVKALGDGYGVRGVEIDPRNGGARYVLGRANA